MKRLLFTALLTAFGCGAATITVSPKGNDAWAEGPLASLNGARLRVRALRAAGKMASNETAKVVFEAGEYPLLKPVEFTPEDSFVSYQAAPGAEVTFSGGKTLGAFTKRPDGLWQAELPEGLAFEQLYVNGIRAQRAKSPNEFYFYMREPVAYGKDPVTGKTDADLSRRAFIANPKDLKGLEEMSAADLSNVVLRVYHSWEVSQSRLQQVDTKSGLVVGTDSSHWAYFFWKPYLPRYVLENYRAALDSPGEWYADFAAKTLFYMPRPGEEISKTRAVVPVAESFLQFKGNAREGKWIRDICFHGLAFQHTAYHLPANGQGDGQAAVSQPAAIVADGCKGVVFRNCEISHIGTHGIRLRKGCRDCEVSHCLITDIGGGAVYIGDSRWSKEELPDFLTGKIRVDNNILQDGGHVFPGSIGVWIGHAADVSLTHNDIADFFYSGVSIGWTWGYAPTVTRRNVIAFNHIHHVGKGVLNDMGAIYSLGDQAGMVVSNNCIHDVWSYDYTGRGGWGLYTDEGSAGIVFENNLIFRTKTGSVHQHYGRGNVFRNNIFAQSMNGQIQRSRVEDHTTIIVTNNIIYWDNDSVAIWRGGRTAKDSPIRDMIFDYNVYWNPKGIGQESFSGRSWDEWRKAGQDSHSLLADPQFVNPDSSDFRMRPSSPALAAGFRPFDASQAGVYGEEAWKQRARHDYGAVRFAPVPERYGVKKLETDFEEFPVGKSCPAFALKVEKKGDAIRVTDKLAYRGKKSLQVLDAQGLANRFNPHFSFSTVITNGWAENRYAIRLDKGAQVFNEWRDYPSDGGYRQGPSLNFADGKLFAFARTKKADGKTVNTREPVAEIPADTWVEVAVRCLAGASQPDGVPWTLHVKIPGKPEIMKSYLTIAPSFRQMSWIGFGSDATNAVSFYLDSFSFQTR